jgi:hypothetical protein
MAAALDLFAWVEGTARPYPAPDLIILDAWPLRHRDVVRWAQAQLTGHATPLILLGDGPQTALLAKQLGATAILPVLFTVICCRVNATACA